MGLTGYCRSCDRTTALQVGGPSACERCGTELDVTLDLTAPEQAPPAPNTVLLIDDDASVRELLRATLELDGFTVVGEASNGPDGALLAGRLQPALVVLDQLMPAMTGEHTARLIRRTAPGALVVSFSAVLDDQPKWADAFLPKTRIEELPRLLTSLSTEASRAPRPSGFDV